MNTWPQFSIKPNLLPDTRIYVKVKDSRKRPDVAQRVPGGLCSQDSMTFGTWRCWVCQSHAPAAFTLRKCSWYSFSLGDESIPEPLCGRKEYVTEKSSDTNGNRFWDRPTTPIYLYLALTLPVPLNRHLPMKRRSHVAPFTGSQPVFRNKLARF
jgi:hypothetical protein